MERKVQGLVGKLKSSMKGLGLPSRAGTVKAADVDDDVQARTAEMFGSQPSMSEGRQRSDWQQPPPPSRSADDDGDQREAAAIQKGKVGFKMNRFSLPVFAAAVGAELRGYGVMGGEGAAAAVEQAPATNPAPDAWPGTGGLDPWSSARPGHDPWSVTGPEHDPWSSEGQSRDDPWASLRSKETSSQDPWGATRQCPSDLREGGQPTWFSQQTGVSGSSGTPFHVISSSGSGSAPSAPTFSDFDNRRTAGAATDEWSAADETTAGPADGSGGIRLGKLKLPSFRRMAEAAVDVLRGPTDGMEAQLPVGSRDPSAVTFALEGGGATPRQDMRTMLREKLQRGFRRSSSASAGLGTMTGSDPWPASGSQPTATSSYGHLPGATAGYDDDAYGYRSAAGGQAVRAVP